MGRRGPLAMPDNVRALRGNPGKRQSPKTVKLPPRAPEPPEGLDEEALAEWGRVVPELDRYGLLALVDRAVLVSYVTAWSRMRQAEAIVDAEGLTVLGAKAQIQRHPAVGIMFEAKRLMLQYAKELLVTPNARLRSTGPGGEASGDDEGVGLLD